MFASHLYVGVTNLSTRGVGPIAGLSNLLVESGILMCIL